MLCGGLSVDENMGMGCGEGSRKKAERNLTCGYDVRCGGGHFLSTCTVDSTSSLDSLNVDL